MCENYKQSPHHLNLSAIILCCLAARPCISDHMTLPTNPWSQLLVRVMKRVLSVLSLVKCRAQDFLYRAKFSLSVFTKSIAIGKITQRVLSLTKTITLSTPVSFNTQKSSSVLQRISEENLE